MLTFKRVKKDELLRASSADMWEVRRTDAGIKDVCGENSIQGKCLERRQCQTVIMKKHQKSQNDR